MSRATQGPWSGRPKVQWAEPIPIRDNAGTLSGDIAPIVASLNVVCSPGDGLAVERGCTCPVKSNWNGEGAPLRKWGMRPATIDYPQPRVYLVDADCPLHGALRAESEAAR